jgi:hypothetical protein
MTLFGLATHAWRQGVPVAFFDNKHGPQTELPVPLPQLTALEASFELGEQGSWLSEAASVELFAAGLEAVAYVHSGVLHLHDAADSLFKQQKDARICLPQLTAQLRRLYQQTRQYSKQQQLESAINAIRRVIGPDGQLFSGVKTLPVQRRFEQGHLVHLASEPPEAKRLVINLLRQYFLRYAQFRGFNDRSLRWLVIADDARQLVSEVTRKGAVAIDQGQDLLDRAQSAGQGLVVATQSLAGLPQNLVEEADLVVMIGQQIDADISAASRRAGWNHLQRQYLQTQPPYHAVFHHRQGFVQPYPVLLSPPDKALLPHEQVRSIQAQAKEQLLAGVQPTLWKPPADRPASPGSSATSDQTNSVSTKPAPQLGVDARHLLGTLCSSPYLLQSEAYELIGSKGHRRLGTVMAELEGHGLVKIHSLGNCKPVEVLPFVQVVGLKAPMLEGRGGFVHNWLCRRVQAYNQAMGNDVKLEFAWHQGRFDAWVRYPNGDTLVYEVMMSLSNIPQTLDKIATYGAGVASVICGDTVAKKKIAAAIKQRDNKLLVEILPASKFILQTKRVCIEAARKGCGPTQ